MSTQTTSQSLPGKTTLAPKYRSKASVRSILELILTYVFMLVFCLFILVPFIWPFVSAFTNKPANVSSLYLYWPKEFTWQHFYDAIIGRGQALVLLRNSILVAVTTVFLSMVICSMGGYALSRGRFRGKRNLMFAILLVQIIPGTATVLPLYLIMLQVHLVDNLLGVILGATAGQLPFMLWVMKGFMDTVPIELEEAAWLDGATQFQTLMEIVFPLSLPGVGAASIDRLERRQDIGRPAPAHGCRAHVRPPAGADGAG